MKHFIFQKKWTVALVLVFLLAWVWLGCSTTTRQTGNEPSKSPGQETEGLSSKYGGRYYSFDDVLVPGELNYKPSRSFVYETPEFKAGALFFTKWRLDVDSLINFFNYNMEKDHWKPINSYRAKSRFSVLGSLIGPVISGLERSGMARRMSRSGSGPLVPKRCSQKSCCASS